ncbi:MAG: electron transfer flavoprotein subunit alpha, partial [Bacteroidetes bacterium]
MNNVFVICETDEGKVADISLELMTKGRSLANDLKCKLEAVVLGQNLKGIENELYPYGADEVHIGDDIRLDPYTTLPHTAVIIELFKETKPQIALLGASTFGRDLGPRISSALQSGLTADCTALEIGDHFVKKENKEYRDLLYQIRPAFGGNIVATIINPDHRPQMATVREGVMKKEVYDKSYKGKLNKLEVDKYLKPEDLVVKVIERHMEKSKV